MALSKIQPASMDLTANYAFTGTNSVAGLEYAEKKLATQTASSSGTLSFTSNIDSTYNIYKFRFVNIHPETNNKIFQFQGSTDSGGSYGVTITSTAFRAYHNEAGSSSNLDYVASWDLAQSTNYKYLAEGIRAADSDGSASGELFLFDPSSTTFVKNFISNVNYMQSSSESIVLKTSGYFNTTSAIDAIQFKMDSGNIDSGTIEMYGIN